MRGIWTLLLLTGGLSAAPGTLLKASRLGHVLVLDEVFLNGTGPFRMAIDTGNASSLIRPEVALRLNAKPTYVVEQVTAGGARRVPVVLLALKVGDVSDPQVETMIGEVGQDGVDGILGQSWLLRHDYLLDYRHRLLALDGAPPHNSPRLTLRSSEGRPLIEVEVDGRATRLVLDSGAAAVVLFERGRVRTTAAFFTNGASGAAEETGARVGVPGGRERRLRALRVGSSEELPGLLPASAFAAVFVCNREGYAVLAR